MRDGTQKYFKAAGSGRVILQGTKRRVVSSPVQDTNKIKIILQDENYPQGEYWYCFMQIPKDLFTVLVNDVARGETIFDKIFNSLPFLLEAQKREGCRNIEVEYSISLEKATELFDEPLPQ